MSVYRARDTRLDRTAALEFLPQRLAGHLAALERLHRDRANAMYAALRRNDGWAILAAEAPYPDLDENWGLYPRARGHLLVRDHDPAERLLRRLLHMERNLGFIECHT